MDRDEIAALADKLYIKLYEDELEALYNEFDYITESMELISNIDGINNYAPMHMVPYTDSVDLRDDKIKDSLTTEQVLKNSGDVLENCVKLPKVVE